MPLENLNGLHYSAVEKTTVNTAIASIENSLTAKLKTFRQRNEPDTGV